MKWTAKLVREQLLNHWVEWDDILCPNRLTYKVRKGLCTEVHGNNIVIDGDYKWLPRLTNLRLAEKQEPDNG